MGDRRIVRLPKNLTLFVAIAITCRRLSFKLYGSVDRVGGNACSNALGRCDARLNITAEFPSRNRADGKIEWATLIDLIDEGVSHRRRTDHHGDNQGDANDD